MINKKSILVALLIYIFGGIALLLITVWLFRQQSVLIQEKLLLEARSIFESVVSIRKWNAWHGGLFVYEHDGLKPNPYLENGSIRDENGSIRDENGRLLIKINPAWMTRQLSEFQKSNDHVRFSLTSLNPLNPENAPGSDFEKRALQAFENDASRKDFYEFNQNGDFNYMGALKTELECLKCHARQGYRIGDIRGGIRVSLNTRAYRLQTSQLNRTRNIILVFFFLILTVLPYPFVYLMKKLSNTSSRLQKLNQNLRSEVEKRARELSSVTESMGDGVYVLNISRELIYANPSFERILGFNLADLLGKEIHEIVHAFDKNGNMISSDDCPIHKGLENNTIYQSDDEIFTKKDGTQIPVQVVSTPITRNGIVEGSVTVFQDISLKKKAETELRRSNEELSRRVEEETNRRLEQERAIMQKARLITLGEMMGAIAHQWRQPLNNTGILIQEIAEAKKSGELTDQYLNKLVHDAMDQLLSMSNTINSFRNFFQEDTDSIDFDLIESLEDVMNMFSDQFRSMGIRIDAIHQAADGSSYAIGMGSEKGGRILPELFVHGFANDFKHSLMNIVTNSRDAINDRIQSGGLEMNSGRITIRTGKVGGNAFLEISDNGGGVGREILDRMFEPYYTTRELHRNVGIGLHMSRTIIEKNMKGRIEAVNGTEGLIMTLYIPVSKI